MDKGLDEENKLFLLHEEERVKTIVRETVVAKKKKWNFSLLLHSCSFLILGTKVEQVVCWLFGFKFCHHESFYGVSVVYILFSNMDFFFLNKRICYKIAQF